MKLICLAIALAAFSSVNCTTVKLYTSKNYKNKCGEVSGGWVSGHEYHNVPAACVNKVQSFQISVSAIDSGVRLWSKKKASGEPNCGGSEAGYTTEDWSRPSISDTWNKKINCIEFIG
ncbi:uncharacterized protein B0P05DRAFT_590201 [Gilbertella persicaria]|uniref:Uncharacterized protein n=1 Tax=Rhizopus stolonifer TaxID=4846 RepID=A0A367IWX1_RHIST|nr:uncharacterized protein B0P05DRAFT_590201 [Gilbertella persicaria]KAI8063669.1 hypothetical protein B0P05DRAFT_590201 [Gilbertella persicaria]RCH82178.1 hypothetical protein CU098_008566 [Rhizopus stolonifer]